METQEDKWLKIPVQRDELEARAARLAFTFRKLGGGTPQRLTRVEPPREFQPVWSPNGQSIVFVTCTEKGGQVWKAVNGALTPLTKQASYYHDPVWTPDGSGVVVMRARTQDRRANTQPLRDDVVLLSDGALQRIALADGSGSPHFANEPDRVYLHSAQQGAGVP